MEVREGFIVGVFNYCDRWCETCALTSWCRLFADVAEMEAQLDPNLKAVVEAPLRREDVPPPPPRWMQELIDEMNEAAAEPMSAADLEASCPRLTSEQERVLQRAQRYSHEVLAWLGAHPSSPTGAIGNPAEVLAWFHSMIAVKTRRALNGLADETDSPEWATDHNGSAKVALLGIDRSCSAWLQLIDAGAATVAEPDEVAKLLAGTLL